MLANQFHSQHARISRLLDFASRHVAYYATHLPSNAHLFSDIAEWQSIPLLDKHQIQTNWSDFVSDPNVYNNSNVEFLYTSGSSGIPLKIIRPKSELRIQARRIWQTRSKWYPDVMRSRLLSLRSLVESLNQDAMHLCSSTNLLDLSFSAIAKYVKKIGQYQPDWMEGTPSAIYRFAEFYERESISPPLMKFIEVTGEELLVHQRALIENVFQCPVVNHYGCREFWIISYECPRRSMHAWTDDLILEVVDEGRPVQLGEIGELVVTSLTNFTMPLIRYKLADYVQMLPSNCPCGDPRPILNPIGGRTGALVITQNKIYRTAFLNELFSRFIMGHEQMILAYQVIQTHYDRFEIYIVPGSKLRCANGESQVRDEISKAISFFLPEMHCTFIFCTEIPLLPSGKMPLFISKIKS